MLEPGEKTLRPVWAGAGALKESDLRLAGTGSHCGLRMAPPPLVPQPGSSSLTLTSRWAIFWLCRNWMAMPMSRMISAASADTESG